MPTYIIFIIERPSYVCGKSVSVNFSTSTVYTVNPRIYIRGGRFILSIKFGILNAPSGAFVIQEPDKESVSPVLIFPQISPFLQLQYLLHKLPVLALHLVLVFPAL